RSGSTVFRSKEAALTEMGDEINQDLVDLDLPNPFRDMITFNVPSAYLQEDSLKTISTSLEEHPMVRDVFYQEKFINRILINARRLSFVFLGVALLLVLIAVILIHNTVRLALYANRFLIKTQELVGATWSFISRPYLRRAFWHGLLSGLLAVAGLIGIQLWLQTQAPELQLFERPLWLGILYFSLLLLGVLISYISHYSVVRRYLRMRVDDLY
ncbi:MAG: FtsX-like permease family protein, partial [Bacteroidota bacterium]